MVEGWASWAHFVETAPIGMAQAAADGTIGPVNPAGASLLGIDEAMPRALREISPVIDSASREILRSDPQRAVPVRRMLTLDTPEGRRSIDLIGWLSMRGDAPVASLVMAHEPLATGVSVLSEAVDRARAAREIHDGLAQDLWLAKMAAAGLDRNPSLDAGARALCVDLRRAIEAALSETRTALMAVQSVDDPTPPFSELLNRHVNEFSDRFGIRVECDIDNGLRIPPRVAVEMFRVVQEALNNVRKHARPGRVSVRLEERRNSIVLSVRDNGTGFDPSIKSSGYGRLSMHERAQAVGGRLTIASRPGRGTSVTLRVPIGAPGPSR